ncbi:MAG: DUF4838 domain-containing protein [Clostridia bacterium]|nr:DUF4838 domain-containing protein [Clostridia bacterium]
MKIRSLFSGLLAGLMILSFVGCSSGKKGDDSTNTDIGTSTNPENAVDFVQSHYATNTLHKVKTVETDTIFIKNGQSDYKIVVGETTEAQQSASFMQSRLYDATGCSLPIVDSSQVEWTASGKYIIIDSSALFNSANLTMPTDDLGTAGYYIKSIGNSTFLMCKNKAGYQYATLAFLREIVGYDMLAFDTVIYEKSGEKFLDMEIIEAPDFELSVNRLTYATNDYYYGMGQTDVASAWAKVGGGYIHNSFKYLPPDDYAKTHDKWYSEGEMQLCYTAGGDEDEYQKMVQTVAEKVKATLDENPNLFDVSISVQDNTTSCACDGCKAEYAIYGCDSAAIIKFANNVASLVDSWYEQEATENGTKKREFFFAFLAYNKYFAPPVKLVDGKYVPIDDTVKCNDNVGVWLAPIGAKYNYSFYEEENLQASEQIKGWASLTDRMYFWLYQTNFNSWLYPYNDFESILETYRFCKNYGAVYMFNQSQSTQGTSIDAMTGFHVFKLYLSKCGMFNVNVEYQDVLNKFFKYYYQDGADAMREYYDSLCVWLEYLQRTYPEFSSGNIYSLYENEKFWPKKQLDQWLDLIDKAMQSIEKYKTTDKDLYEKLYNHILKESIFPRYSLITIYKGMYAPSQLTAMRKSFKSDCALLGLDCYAEGDYLSVKYSEWGI